MHAVSEWLTGMGARIDTITDQLREVGDAASRIGRIATQTHILALNASIGATARVFEGDRA
ncbi:MAG TPA: hypothetical protein VIJ96_01375 [Acidothermaceae bacterium]